MLLASVRVSTLRCHLAGRATQELNRCGEKGDEPLLHSALRRLSMRTSTWMTCGAWVGCCSGAPGCAHHLATLAQAVVEEALLWPRLAGVGAYGGQPQALLLPPQ